MYVSKQVCMHARMYACMLCARKYVRMHACMQCNECLHLDLYVCILSTKCGRVYGSVYTHTHADDMGCHTRGDKACHQKIGICGCMCIRTHTCRLRGMP